MFPKISVPGGDLVVGDGFVDSREPLGLVPETEQSDFGLATLIGCETVPGSARIGGSWRRLAPMSVGADVRAAAVVEWVKRYPSNGRKLWARLTDDSIRWNRLAPPDASGHPWHGSIPANSWPQCTECQK